MLWSSDHQAAVAELRRLAPAIKTSSDRAWSRDPAVRVIDCVLSLNRPYDRFVVPRLDRFEKTHPETRSIDDLYRLIRSCQSAHRFMKQDLDYDHEDRAIILDSVVARLRELTNSCNELETLERWANHVQPKDYVAFGIRGFVLGGFQYLRMLFGANTTKPDIHICRKVAEWVGHRVSPVRALQILEAAAEEAGVSLRDLDTTIWEESARGIRRARSMG